MFEVPKAYAQSGYAPLDNLGGRLEKTVPIGPEAFNSYLNNMFDLFLMVAVALAVIMIVIGAFQVILGDTLGSKSEGWGKIRSAFIGLFFALCVILILNEINPNITSFDLGIRRPIIGVQSALINTPDSSGGGGDIGYGKPGTFDSRGVLIGPDGLPIDHPASGFDDWTTSNGFSRIGRGGRGGRGGGGGNMGTEERPHTASRKQAENIGELVKTNSQKGDRSHDEITNRSLSKHEASKFVQGDDSSRALDLEEDQFTPDPFFDPKKDILDPTTGKPTSEELNFGSDPEGIIIHTSTAGSHLAGAQNPGYRYNYGVDRQGNIYLLNADGSTSHIKNPEHYFRTHGPNAVGLSSGNTISITMLDGDNEEGGNSRYITRMNGQEMAWSLASTDAQLQATVNLGVDYLMERHPTIRYVYGHGEIQGDRSTSEGISAAQVLRDNLRRRRR